MDHPKPRSDRKMVVPWRGNQVENSDRNHGVGKGDDVYVLPFRAKKNITRAHAAQECNRRKHRIRNVHDPKDQSCDPRDARSPHLRPKSLHEEAVQDAFLEKCPREVTYDAKYDLTTGTMVL